MQMTAEAGAAARSPNQDVGSVSLTKSGMGRSMLYITLPKSIAQQIEWDRVDVTFDPLLNSWVIQDNPATGLMLHRVTGDRARVGAGGAGYLKHFGGRFPATDAIVSLSGGRVGVKLLSPPKVADGEKKPEEVPAPVEHDIRNEEPAAPVPTRIASEEDMRAVLALVREIEAASPYRLTRIKRGDDDVLVWRAPTIE